MNRRYALQVSLAGGIAGLVRLPLYAEDDKPR